jgi:hypothetical protein
MQAVCSVWGFFEESAVLHASQSVHSHTKSIHDLHFKVSIFCTQDRCDREPHYPANGVAIPAVGSPPLELPHRIIDEIRPESRSCAHDSRVPKLVCKLASPFVML